LQPNTTKSSNTRPNSGLIDGDPYKTHLNRDASNLVENEMDWLPYIRLGLFGNDLAAIDHLDELGNVIH